MIGFVLFSHRYYKEIIFLYQNLKKKYSSVRFLHGVLQRGRGRRRRRARAVLHGAKTSRHRIRGVGAGVMHALPRARDQHAQRIFHRHYYYFFSLYYCYYKRCVVFGSVLTARAVTAAAATMRLTVTARLC